MADKLLNEAPEHLDAVLETLVELRRRLDLEMNSGLAASAGAGINPNHVRLGVQIASASAQLGREVRAWQKRTKETAQTASLEERKLAVRRFLEELPAADRAALLDGIDD